MYQRKTQQSIFDHVKDFLGYQRDIRTRIINDKILVRKQWEPYYMYLTYLNFWRKNLDGIIKSLQRNLGENISGQQTKGRHQLSPFAQT